MVIAPDVLSRKRDEPAPFKRAQETYHNGIRGRSVS